MGVAASSLTHGLKKEYKDRQHENFQNILAGMTISERNLIFDRGIHFKCADPNLNWPLNQHISRYEQVQKGSTGLKSFSEVGIRRRVSWKNELSKSEGAVQVKSSHDRNEKLLAGCDSTKTFRPKIVPKDTNTNINEQDLCSFNSSVIESEAFKAEQQQIQNEIAQNLSSESNSFINVPRQRIPVEEIQTEDDETATTHIVLRTAAKLYEGRNEKLEQVQVEYIYQKDLGHEEFKVDGCDFENILPVNEEILDFQNDYDDLQNVDYFLTFLDYFMNNFFGYMIWNNFKIDLMHPIGQRFLLYDFDFEPSTLIFSLKGIEKLTFLQTAHHFEIIGQTDSLDWPYKKFTLEGDNIQGLKVTRGKKFIRINLPS